LRLKEAALAQLCKVFGLNRDTYVLETEILVIVCCPEGVVGPFPE
jgi:hypothetical protein